ncbi:uncharacterized protein LOC121836999 [Ixodes scapularis]|uniref:uncharacterized protein LOC121836999 n=1 Tax=Ixodes scapularis TaxID=6945 RepID=UPI001C384F54|nr:uncharacterized protein LOC121836999 [Ixodes scapularis]
MQNKNNINHRYKCLECLPPEWAARAGSAPPPPRFAPPSDLWAENLTVPTKTPRPWEADVQLPINSLQGPFEWLRFQPAAWPECGAATRCPSGFSKAQRGKPASFGGAGMRKLRCSNTES